MKYIDCGDIETRVIGVLLPHLQMFISEITPYSIKWTPINQYTLYK